MSDSSVKMDSLLSANEQEGSHQQKHTLLQKFGMLTKFMLPLALTQMIPDVAEQAINRGITSLASDDMVLLLASYGLAYYILRFLAASAIELRHVGIVLVHNKRDNIRMTIFAITVGVIFSLLVLVIGLSPLGTWIIRDLHRQSQEVSDTTCRILTYLTLIPLIEALANYYEGGLICRKLTAYAGLARITDFMMQVTFTIVFLFTPTSTEPVFVPVFALYAGMVGRLILNSGFWYVLVKPKLPPQNRKEKPLTIRTAICFWLPLTLVRFVQMFSYPVINIMVSRNLSLTNGEEEAAKAVAVLTATYPTCRCVFSWLNDLRTIAPTFHKKTKHHEKFKMKVIALYSLFCTLTAFSCSIILYVTPQVGYFIMNTIIGLNEELAMRSLTPLKIFSLAGLMIGGRGYFTGIIIMKKKTQYLSPSAFVRLGSVIMLLNTLPNLGVKGAILATSSGVLSFALELIAVIVAAVVVRYKAVIGNNGCCRKQGMLATEDISGKTPALEENEEDDRSMEALAFGSTYSL